MAEGAATLLSLGASGSSFADVIAMPIGVAVGARFKELIKANTQVPSSHSFPLSVPRELFDGYSLEVYQGNELLVENNEYLGRLPANLR